MWMTRDGEVRDFDPKMYDERSLKAKSWVPCDPPAAPPELTRSQKRQTDYEKAGLTAEKLALVMWEELYEPSEAHTQARKDFQAARAEIKARHP